MKTTPQRSAIMRAIKGKDTTPERAVAAAFTARGVRYRKNVRSMPGSPDLANQSRQFAVFVHGCFWHRHRCKAGKGMPKTNARFWRAKFERNLIRDRVALLTLRKAGYDTLVIWECQTKDAASLARTVDVFMRNVERRER